MATDLKTILKNHLPIDNLSQTSIKQPSIGAVDKLADELVAEYDNQKFRQWYCGVVYEFGVSQVLEWRKRAKEGKAPAKLFSKYVKDARTFRSSRNV